MFTVRGCWSTSVLQGFVVLNYEDWTCMHLPLFVCNDGLSQCLWAMILWLQIVRFLNLNISWKVGCHACWVFESTTIGLLMVYQRKRSSWRLPCFWRAYINWRWRLLSGWKVRTNFPLQAMTSPSGSAHNGLHWKIGLQSLERCGQWRMKNRRKLLWFEICENRQIGKCWWPVQCWRDSPSCWKLTVANGAAGLTWLKHYSSI